MNKHTMNKYQILKEYFGYTSFRSGQEEIIDALMSGQNALGIMPTGAGKSLCFQIPALLSDGITIVISPLISLMKDQVEALLQNGIQAAYINSSMTYQQIQDVLYDAAHGIYKIIYVAPERLCSDDFLEFSRTNTISMLTIDEAHCVSQWGNDFRPSYLNIADYYKSLSYKPVISAFTATATNEVKADIISALDMKNPLVLTTGFDRTNLHFSVESPKDKFGALIGILDRNAGKCGIVYCSTRKNTDEVYSGLCEKGYQAVCYHAGMSAEDRKKNQEYFLYDKKNIMVATNAFGMGIDKSNVSFVVHYNMPKDIESYYQEAGRAGRDGSPAECILLYGKADVRTNQFLIENSEPNENIDELTADKLRQRDMERLKKMVFYCTISECLRHYLLKYFGEESENFCGNCGNCDSNYETADVTVDSQKILSCIVRAKQNYGASTIASILRGSKNEKILRMGLDKLTTHGIMKDKKSSYIYEVMNFLEYNGYIFSTKDKYPVLKVTEKAREVLKGETVLEMKTVHKEKEQPINITQSAHDELFAELRRVRTNIALEQQVPAYVIFSDATLSDICAKLPSTKAEFLDISGVGERKLELYGEQFIAVVNNYIKLHGISGKKENPQVKLLKEAAASLDKVVTEEAVTITQLCRNIMDASSLKHGTNKLRDMLTKWLIENKYLKEEKNFRGILSKRAGNAAGDIGIFEEARESFGGEMYYTVYYSEDAQKFILNNFDNIIEYYTHIV